MRLTTQHYFSRQLTRLVGFIVKVMTGHYRMRQSHSRNNQFLQERLQERKYSENYCGYQCIATTCFHYIITPVRVYFLEIQRNLFFFTYFYYYFSLNVSPTKEVVVEIRGYIESHVTSLEKKVRQSNVNYNKGKQEL